MESHSVMVCFNPDLDNFSCGLMKITLYVQWRLSRMMANHEALTPPDVHPSPDYVS